MFESEDKMVSHPSHYQLSSGIEVIDIIEEVVEPLEGVEAYLTGTILKYICRWNGKNGVQDLEKAMWYTDRLINHLNMKEIVEPSDDIHVSFDEVLNSLAAKLGEISKLMEDGINE